MKKLLLLLMIWGVLFFGSTCNAYEVWNWDIVGHIPELAVDKHDYGPRLLLSDNPETADEFGVLYQDFVFGKTRLFMHHVNGTTTPAWIGAVLQNEGDTDVMVEVTKHNYIGPDYDYSLVGKRTNLEYFAFNMPYRLVVPAHQTRLLDDMMLRKLVYRNQLVTGMYDCNVHGRLLMKTVMAPHYREFVEYSATAAILPKENMHPRGTFATGDRALFFRNEYRPLADGLCAITLADNIIDKYLIGIDGITGEQVVNFGNYGVVYRLFLIADENQPFNIYLNPRGGTYGGALAYRPGQTLLWENIDTPKGRTVFGEQTVYHVEQVMTINHELVTQLLFSPPGASNLPIKLLFAPPNFDLQKFAAENKIKYPKED
ncbi:MAG: copper amine oxidase [Negativicutes bacterium]